MRTDFLPFSAPSHGDEEIAAVVEALRSGWVTRGPRTARFEQEFQAFVSAPAALGTNSCTAGLHLALLALDIGPGDEVVVPTMTFAASANVVEHVGARPVLVDVEPDTLNIDPSALEATISPRTRAVIVVHFAGHPADLAAIVGIADRHGLQIVEDAAHSLPASFRGEGVGSSDRLTAFSFYATKNLTTGEGGMLTGDAALVEKARVLSFHGMSGDAWRRYSDRGRWYYEISVPGFKYNMTDLQAAMGLVQLKRLPVMQARRRAIVECYTDGLRGLEQVELPAQRSDSESAWHLYPIRVGSGETSEQRDRFIERLTELQIGTSVHFIPLHVHPFYRDKYGYRPGAFPVAHRAFHQLLSLPLHPGLTGTDVDDVIQAVRTAALS